MSKSTVTQESFERITDGLYTLTDILIEIGIMELKISSKEQTIFWDTENKGQVDGKLAGKFFDACENFALKELIY